MLDTGFQRITIFILASIEYPVSCLLWHNSQSLNCPEIDSLKRFEPTGYCSDPDGSLIEMVKRFNVRFNVPG